jgi:hypothetical protein
MKVIVCGGRDYQDLGCAFSRLDAIHAETPVTLLIQGGAIGADTLAYLWAESRKVECVTVTAEWVKYGPSAGPIRNGRMLEYKPDLVIAFPGGRGTANMVKQARKAGIAVVEPR